MQFLAVVSLKALGSTRVQREVRLAQKVARERNDGVRRAVATAELTCHPASGRSIASRRSITTMRRRSCG